MKNVMLVSRLLLGAIYFVFGLNAFLSFLQMPPLQGMAGQFVGALVQSGYFFPFLKTIETVGGLLLILGIFMPLNLLVLFPITLNIALFHLFLGLDGLPIAILMLLAHLLLLWGCRSFYKSMLVMSVKI